MPAVDAEIERRLNDERHPGFDRLMDDIERSNAVEAEHIRRRREIWQLRDLCGSAFAALGAAGALRERAAVNCPTTVRCEIEQLQERIDRLRRLRELQEGGS